MPRAKVRRFRSLRKTLDIREAAVKARTTLRSRLRAGLKNMAPFKPRASSDSIITWCWTMVSRDLSTGARCGLNVSGGSARQSAQECRPKRAASLRHSRQNACEQGSRTGRLNLLRQMGQSKSMLDIGEVDPDEKLLGDVGNEPSPRAHSRIEVVIFPYLLEALPIATTSCCTGPGCTMPGMRPPPPPPPPARALAPRGRG
mmetsp:Transcript_95920/g.250025  ORF Transcript_95920/g.250025 Transcript_95920/m.250025 type:complete len:201 (-) Transcript_95920:66-668(-)